MTYQTLYRKYRSNNLTELVGQSHIVQTLENALTLDRLNHAYIFSGPRGTGKTSTARILAKMVNKTIDNMEDCDICKKISQGSCVDVVEIDAASHTGVDHMRQLTEQVQFLPVETKCKVFIIDEVHMLSTGAFNALLKTLEEPPANILFILATTELHKIPATIQSRSQTLHFRLLNPDQIKSHIAGICEKEGYKIESAALEKLVQIANGGMRDALSFLDQLMSISESKTLGLNDVSSLLGTLDETQLTEFLTACFSNQLDSVQLLHRHVSQGLDIFQLYEDVILFLHDALLIKQAHSFHVPDKIISTWLQWFCDQMGYLKQQPSPALFAQISLQSKINSMTETDDGPPKQNVFTSHSQVDVSPPPVTNFQAQKTPKPEPKDVIPVKSISHEEPQIKLQAMPATGGSADHDDILLHMAKEYKVLEPVLKSAKLIESADQLYLVLEETYQFFKKKLAETKFKTQFLSLYNQKTNKAISMWSVISDVNEIYQHSNSQADLSSSTDTPPVKSKTVNQIIEMFEGQIIE